MLGIFFALGALVFWGIGDFLIQRSTRKFGDWITLFYIEAFVSLALFPFVYKEAWRFFSFPSHLILFLVCIGVVELVAALLDFEALKRGKISVVEPILALEVPVIVSLGVIFVNEYPTALELLLITLVIMGIVLVSAKSKHGLAAMKLERGAWFAFLGTIAMGSLSFLIGVGARHTSPLFINWFTSFFAMTIIFVYLVSRSKVREAVADWKRNKRLIVGVSAVDMMAWIAFAYSVLTIPIAIATSISEAYIVLASALGLVFNKEKLKSHQFVGMALAAIGVISLSLITAR